MAGGGTPVPRPGEISLAHNGVLFLDELPEFHKDVLEVLRQPLEEGWVTISRSAGSERFPARFMLVCAMNPCKCGWYGYGSRCRCSPRDVEKYLGKLSGPLLDRIDLYAEVPPLDFDELSRRPAAEPSSVIRARVEAARAVQAARFGPDGPSCNAHMGPAELAAYCALDADGQAVMKGAFQRMGLTARWPAPSPIWTARRTSAWSTWPRPSSTGRAPICADRAGLDKNTQIGYNNETFGKESDAR